MREIIYERMEIIGKKYHGYISTKELLAENITNRQIANLIEEGYLEKLCNGYFWLAKSRRKKPKDYKAVEVCFVNANAVICADSACYYQGLIDVEPSRLSIATKRTDRRKMSLPFDICRHYFSENSYAENCKTVKTPYGNYNIYSIERSVCDCIRFRENIEEDVFQIILENYRKIQNEKQVKRMMAYARAMKFERDVKSVL